ncbi:sugar phosphate nucleotidyltransferase [Streptomyces sp. NPDC003483]
MGTIPNIPISIAVSQVVVMAGGLGTRLGAQGATRPKVLQPVGDSVFLDVMLQGAIEQGFRDFHFCLGRHSDQVINHLATGLWSDLNVTVSVDPEPRGTAGALIAARPFLRESYILLLGDTYLPLDYRALETMLDADTHGVMVVAETEAALPANTEVTDGRVTGYSKEREFTGGLVDAGVALFRRDALDAVADESVPLDLSAVFRHLITAGRLAALQTWDRFYDIGTPERHAEFCRYWMSSRGEARC